MATAGREGGVPQHQRAAVGVAVFGEAQAATVGQLETSFGAGLFDAFDAEGMPQALLGFIGLGRE